MRIMKQLQFIITLTAVLYFGWIVPLSAQDISDYKIGVVLSSEESIASDFFLSQSGELVAFIVEDQSKGNLKTKLFVAKTDGSEQAVQIAPNLIGGAYKNYLHFSPSEQQVAFIYDSAQGIPVPNFELHVANIDGRDAVAIDKKLAASIFVDFEFSTDGDTLFYVATDDYQTTELYKRSVDAKTPRVRLDEADGEFNNVTDTLGVDSDSSKVVYSVDGLVGANGLNVKGVFAVDAAAGTNVRLDKNGLFSNSDYFLFSDIEKRVVTREQNSASGTPELFATSLDGVIRTKISEGTPSGYDFVGVPRLSNDKKRVIFSAGGISDQKVFSASLSGGNLIDLTQSFPQNAEITDYYLSPNTDFIVFEVQFPGSDGQPLLLVDTADPSSYTLISPNERPIDAVTFDPTGKFVAFKQLMEGAGFPPKSEIFLADIQSASYEKLPAPAELDIFLDKKIEVLENGAVLFQGENQTENTKSLYAVGPRGFGPIKLNRDVGGRLPTDPQYVSNFVQLPSQNRLLYTGNTDDISRQNIFGVDLSLLVVPEPPEQEMCFPIVTRAGAAAIICL